MADACLATSPVTAHAWLLFSWVLAGAAVLVAHAVVVVQALGASELDWRWRAAALLPPLAPVAAWVAGRRVAPVLWLALVVLYAVLRLLE